MSQSEVSTLHDDEIDLLDLFRIVYRYRWLTALFVVLAVGLTALFTLSRERVYESTATILVREDRPLISGTGGDALAGRTDDVLISVLQSRTLAEQVVGAIRLHQQWELSPDEAVDRLRNNLTVETGSIVSVRFQDTSAQRAQQIIDEVLAIATQSLRQISATEDDQTLTFLQTQVQQVGAELEEAEDALRVFKAENNIIDFNQQVDSLVAARNELENRIRAANLELTVRRQYYTEHDPVVRQMMAELSELRAQLTYIVTGEGGGEVSGIEAIPFPLDSVPNLELAFARLTDEVQLLRQTHSELRSQLESLRIEAARVPSLVQQIDPPVVPSAPVPRRLAMKAAVAGVLGIFLGVFTSFALHYLRERASDESTANDLPFMRYFRGEANP